MATTSSAATSAAANATSPPTSSHRHRFEENPAAAADETRTYLPSAIGARSASAGGNATPTVLRSPSASTAGGQHSSSLSHHSSIAASSAAPAYQPTSLADVLANCNGDITRALDEVLVERNKFCLEAGKLSSENVRIWNLMGKIRKENEALKARLQQHQQQQAASTPDRLATPPPIPQRRATHTDASRSVDETPPPSPRAAAHSKRIPSMSSTSHSSPLSASTSLPVVAAARDRSREQPAGAATRTSSASANTASSSSDRTSPNQSQSQEHQQQTHFSAEQASVMQQRAAARALQQEQQRKAAGGGIGGDGARTSSSSNDQHAASSSSQQQGFAHLANAPSTRRNSAGSQDDYVAVDSSSINSEVPTMSAFTNSQDSAVLPSPSPTPASPSPANQPQRDRSRTITAARAAAAAKRAEQEQQQQQQRLTAGLQEDSAGGGDDRFDSIGSSSQASDIMMNTPPRSRKNKLAAMGMPSGSSPSVGVSHSNSSNKLSSLMPASDSFSSPRMRRSPSMLQPRDAVTRGDEVPEDGGSLPTSASFSLTQALMSAAREGPPEPANYTPQPHLTNQLLKQTQVSVNGSNLHYNDKGREVISFFLVVELTQGGRTPQTGLEKWKIEKLYSDVLALDARIKHKHGKAAVKKMAGSNVQLPDKGLFKDHAPSKVDMRKLVLEAYLANLLAISLPDKDELCTFLCTDVVPMRPRDPKSLTKEGFLTKKGQNLGRWVTRFYCLDNNRLQHYEGRGGPHLGSINIRGAQIGRQQRSAASDMDENSYRHAFLILEKRPHNTQQEAGGGSSSSTATSGDHQLVRHVLCAESDEERDDWVDVLVRCIADIERKENGGEAGSSAVAPSALDESADAQQSTLDSAAMPAKPASAMSPRSRALKLGGGTNGHNNSTSVTPSSPTPGPARVKRSGSLGRRLRSRDGPSSSSVPVSSQDEGSHDAAGGGSTTDSAGGNATVSPVPAVLPGHAKDRASVRPSISGPMNGAPIPTGYKFGARDEPTVSSTTNTAAGEAHRRGDDKRRFWHRFGGGGADKAGAARGEARPVFGIPLTDAIAISSVSGGLALPSVVYRCIEYLEKKNAVKEEGIYRMSGSTADVRALRERFNAEGDVDLVKEEEEEGRQGHSYDPHAIAGLLKSYLRELPTSVLTRDSHMDFMRVLDIVDRNERSRELGQLVSNLPLPNYTLLRTLCKHLIKVISYQDVNKMTMRNVGIVFSPTLGIPAGLFSELLTSFDYCFDTGTGTPVLATAAAAASSPRAPAATTTSTHRSKRNSMSYSEEEASRMMGAPSGKHQILDAHSDEGEEEEQEAELDLLRGGDVDVHAYEYEDDAGAGAGAGAGEEQLTNGHGHGHGHHARYVGEARG